MTEGKDRGLEKARTIIEALDERKGDDILLLDLIGVCSFTDYFVISTVPSTRTLKALAETVRKQMKDEYEGAVATAEGDPESGWIVLDYGDVVLHLFTEPVREFYSLEELWGDGKVLVRVK